MDNKIFGIGIAVSLAIIALSAIVLYLSFRIKSTFENDKSVKVQIVKTFFLIGILFMAGGMFYYFAQGMNNTPRMIKNETVSESGVISLGLAYRESVSVNDYYNITFAVKSSSPNTIHNATIKITGLPLLGAKSNFGIEVDKLNLGNLEPGETDGFLQLKAPSYPIVLAGTMLLSSQDTDAAFQDVKINIIDTTTSSSAPKINTTVNKTAPHFDGILPSTNGPASSRNPAPASVETPVQNTNISNDTTNVPNNTINNTTNTTTSNNSSNNDSSTNTTAPNVTATVEPTVTANITSAPTPAPTPTPTPTPAPTLTETPTPTPTPAPTETSTPAPTSAPTETSTPAPTPAPTETPTPTSAPTTSPNSTT